MEMPLTWASLQVGRLDVVHDQYPETEKDNKKKVASKPDAILLRLNRQSTV